MELILVEYREVVFSFNYASNHICNPHGFVEVLGLIYSQ